MTHLISCVRMSILLTLALHFAPVASGAAAPRNGGVPLAQVIVERWLDEVGMSCVVSSTMLLNTPRYSTMRSLDTQVIPILIEWGAKLKADHCWCPKRRQFTAIVSVLQLLPLERQESFLRALSEDPAESAELRVTIASFLRWHGKPAPDLSSLERRIYDPAVATRSKGNATN